MVAPCRTSPETSSDLGLPLDADELSSNHSQRSRVVPPPTSSPSSMLGSLSRTKNDNDVVSSNNKTTTKTQLVSAMSSNNSKQADEPSTTPPSPPVIHNPRRQTTTCNVDDKTTTTTKEREDSPPIPLQEGLRLPREKDLEERVIELESQLATLSRLLQASNALSSSQNSLPNMIRRPMTPPMQPRNISPPFAAAATTPPSRQNKDSDMDDNSHNDDDGSHNTNSNSNHYPHLESPHPEPPEQSHPLGDHHRRLSHVILGTSPFTSPNNTIGRGNDYPPPAPPLAMHVLMEQSPPKTLEAKSATSKMTLSSSLKPTSGTNSSRNAITTDNNDNGMTALGELPTAPLLSHPLATNTDLSTSSATLNNNNTIQSKDNNTNNTTATAAIIKNATNEDSSAVTKNTKNIKDIRNRWLDYLNSYQDTNQDVDRQMEEFVRVPKQVEVLLAFGFWICLDCFLYAVTILPIRFAWACCLGIGTALWDFMMKSKTTPTTTTPGEANPYKFHRRHLYQVITVIIICFVYYYVLMPISIGKLYHWIRGQAMLKLYLLLAIVEVFDRLMCSLGQDCLDSLYWNTTRRPGSVRWFVSFGVVMVYATIHTWLLFVHVATLNVAMNSSDQALLSLLIGGNFAEIKSTVFKKYNKQALFKITTSDICERFKLALFLALVLALNMCQGMSKSMVYGFLEMCCLVYLAELFSDWIKHSFITKFNFIKSGVYPEYGLLLAGDVTGIGHEGVNLDHSHAVVKRIGLPQIPLVCVMARYLSEAARYLGGQVFGYSLTYVMAIVWCFLVVLKIISGSLLSKVAEEKLQNAPQLILMSPAGKAKKKKD